MAELIDLLKTGRQLEDKPYLHTRLERAVAILEGIYNKDDMAGYVVVAVGKDGTHSIGWAIDKDAPFGRRMLGALAAENVREALITNAAIEDAIYGDP